MTELEETLEMCGKVLIAWQLRYNTQGDYASNYEHDPEIANMFLTKMINKKFDAFDVDIVLPDDLIVLLAVAVNGNPGQFQIVLKDILNAAVKRTGKKLPRKYVVTPQDFTGACPTAFPIMLIPSVNDKYHKMYDAQKSIGVFGTNNKMDTPDWWLEVTDHA